MEDVVVEAVDIVILLFLDTLYCSRESVVKDSRRGFCEAGKGVV